MSSTVKAKTQLKQLRTGIHLVTITDTWLLKDAADKIVKSNEGEVGLVIRFTNGKNFSFDKTYWIQGSQKREWEFKKMCVQAGINPAAPKFKAESTGKRLWIYIKEVHDIDGDQYIQDEVTGMPVINYYIFDYSMCDNPQNKPMRMGDPDTNNGEAKGDFLDYRQISDAEKFAMDNKDKVTLPENAPKAERVKAAKEIMGNTLVKASALQPNNEFSMQKDSHYELPKKPKAMELSDDDIFSDEMVSETKEEPKEQLADEENWDI